MRKFFMGIFALILVLFIFFIFTNHAGDNPNNSGVDKDALPEICIGINEPLTGVYSDFGNYELLGIQYANKVCPHAVINGTKYKIELITEDNGSNLETASKIVGEHIEKECIAMIGSQLPDDINDLSDESTIIPIIDIDSSKNSGEEFFPVFSVSIQNKLQARAIANFAYGMELDKCAVVIVDDVESSTLIGEAYMEKFTELGGKCSQYEVLLAQNNFSSLSSLIHEGNFDSVFIAADAEISPKIIKNIRKAGITYPIFGIADWDNRAFVDNCGYRGSNVFLPSDFNETDDENQISADFVANFTDWITYDTDKYEANGETDTISRGSALGYDAYMLLIEALEGSESTKPTDIFTALSQTSYSGITGNITFNDIGETNKTTIYIKKLNTSHDRLEVLQTVSSNT